MCFRHSKAPFGETQKTIYADYANSSIDNNSRSICYIANRIILNNLSLSDENREIVKYYADLYTGADKYSVIMDPYEKDKF